MTVSAVTVSHCSQFEQYYRALAKVPGNLLGSRPSVVSEFVSAGATACTFAHKAAVMRLAKLTAWTVLEIWIAPTVCLRACANFVPAGG